MLVVLLARGLTLPGAMDGLAFYLYPDPTRLVDPQVSKKSAIQHKYQRKLPPQSEAQMWEKKKHKIPSFHYIYLFRSVHSYSPLTGLASA